MPDLLPAKLCALLDIDPSGVAALAEESRQEAENASGRYDLAGKSRVYALAHSIVADVALYYQSDIEKAARDGQFSSLERVLDEARKVLSSQIDAHEYTDSDPIREAFAALMARMQKRRADD